MDDSMIRNWRKKKDAVAKQPKGQRTGIVKFPALEKSGLSIRENVAVQLLSS